MKSDLSVAAAAAIIISGTSASPLKSRDNATMAQSWAEVVPSADLIWTPCFDNFTCSLLEVPLDYSSPSDGTTNIAFIKKPSQNASAEDVIVNSGGPGGSGVDMVISGSDLIEAKLGTQFNLIGMDPRGVNNSGPSVSCFAGIPSYGNTFYADVFAPVDNTSDYGYADGFQRAGAYGDWCSQSYAVNGTAKYINTAAVAQDMLRYIEARAKSKSSAPEEAKLWFYGISYGSILGQTFAALYPDRIGRMIVDGVMTLEDYYTNGWGTAIEDTDKTARAFFTTCFEAGPELCVFHQNATSPEELEARYLAIIAAMKKSPLTFTTVNENFYSPAMVTWRDVYQAFFSLSYFPHTQGGFPLMAQIFAELELGVTDTLILAGLVIRASIPLLNLLDAPVYDSREALKVTTCNDNNGRFNVSSVEEYQSHVEQMVNTSSYGGLYVSQLTGTACRKWGVAAPKSQVFEVPASVAKTSAPILFIGNTADPITPLAHAKKSSSIFGGSAVLTANMPGHCTFGVTSKCVDGYTQAYMLDASLPPPDTVCEVEEKPFISSGGSGVASAPTKRFAPML